MRIGSRSVCAPQVGGTDCVRFVDDRRTPLLVAADGHGQAEGEDEPDEAEQRRLHDAERLSQRVGMRAQSAADERPEERRPEQDSEDQQPELEAAQAEDTVDSGSPSSSTAQRSGHRVGRAWRQ